MVNVADQEFVTPGPVVRDELGWSLAVAVIWWLQDLHDRRIVLCPEQSMTTNLGYNSQGTTVAALTVLTGGVATAVSGNPWPCFVTLLFFKHLYELGEDLGCGTNRAPKSADGVARDARGGHDEGPRGDPTPSS